eukprot:Colp12_sorted_trinity150504_noHs@33831
MAQRIAIDISQMSADVDADAPCYWRPENHTGADNYLRVENWLKDVEEFTFSRANEHRAIVPVTHDEGVALLRYKEEVKLYASIVPESAYPPEAGYPKGPLDDPEFYDKHWDATVLVEWPNSKMRSVWFNSLKNLERKLDEAIKPTLPIGAFVKLSVRSPKDSVFLLSKTKHMIRERLQGKYKDDTSKSSATALSEEVEAIRWASWQALRVTTGAEAMRILLRSDRIYLDVLQHDLFTKGDPAKFDLDVHVATFYDGFDPALEFRGFVVNGTRSAITAYSPWVYDERIIKNKDLVHKVITETWDQVQPRIRSDNYSVDFALSPDLKTCFIVEINNFLPPLAGCGLFVYQDDSDRAILEGRSPY